MRVLFTVAIPFVLEPLGVMLLSAICKRAGHSTGLAIVSEGNLCDQVDEFDADVVAYSVIGSDLESLRKADDKLKCHLKAKGKKLFRIMGGPHPTYSPTVLDDMGLDAICQGDGDHALPELLARLEKGQSIDDIPNIATTSAGPKYRKKLSSQELDELPFADRDLYLTAVPFVRSTGLRSFIASRGCPYSCAYCYNHAYNLMYKDTGPVVRRRSVENVLAEIEYNIREFPPVRFVRFFDDTFSFRADSWLEEFAEKYSTRIGIPFYCLMRPNTFTEDTARLLKKAGCYSLSMAVEAGSEKVRNGILDRGLSDQEMIRAFDLSRKYKLRTYGNTMIGIPGSMIDDDFVSLNFARRLGVSVPTFTICSPSRGTKLAQIAEEKGLLPPQADMVTRFAALSPLNCYSRAEKEIQTRITYLGSLYCQVPKLLAPVVLAFIKHKLLPMRVMRTIGFASAVSSIALRIFPHAIPKSPATILRVALNGIKYFI